MGECLLAGFVSGGVNWRRCPRCPRCPTWVLTFLYRVSRILRRSHVKLTASLGRFGEPIKILALYVRRSVCYLREEPLTTVRLLSRPVVEVELLPLCSNMHRFLNQEYRKPPLLSGISSISWWRRYKISTRRSKNSPVLTVSSDWEEVFVGSPDLGIVFGPTKQKGFLSFLK